MRIGYVPQSNSLQAPADRRRFVYYANKRGLDFEIADPSKNYDIVVLTEAADISQWRKFPAGKGKLVFQQINSYLKVGKHEWRTWLRGPAKFVARQNRFLQVNYTQAIQQMCKRADAVVCSTEEQRLDILEFCENVHPILDFHENMSKNKKKDYSRAERFRFVWEGQAQNIADFAVIRNVLSRLQDTKDFSLNFVTDLSYPMALRNIGKRSTRSLINRMCDVENTLLYEWNEALLSSISIACDLAIIPMRLQDPLFYYKPENKLLLFWSLGIPVVTSATPAYTRVMDKCNLNMSCHTENDWLSTLDRYMNNEEDRRYAGLAGLEYVMTYHTEEVLLAKWDTVLESL